MTSRGFCLVTTLFLLLIRLNNAYFKQRKFRIQHIVKTTGCDRSKNDIKSDLFLFYYFLFYCISYYFITSDLIFSRRY